MKFELIVKKLTKELSSKEKAIFDEWYKSSSKHRKYYEKVENNYLKKKKPVATDQAWKVIISKLNHKQKRSYWKLAVAAFVIGIIAISGLFRFLSNDLNSTTINSVTSSPIEIGAHKAILTLENGTDVVLTNKKFKNNYIKSNGSEIIYEPLSSRSSTKDIAYNYLTIPRGGEFFVRLSDGTKVWLNSDSKLKYPIKFVEGKTRKIELLYGEAYFEVSPSTEHKGATFKVATGNQEVEVLGTQFNIKAYRDETKTYTTLVEGKVALTTPDINEILKPGQQAVLSPTTKKIEIHSVDVFNEISWKEGVFSFKGKTLKEIMKVLSRWYDVEVIYGVSKNENTRFTGVLGKEQSLENILSILSKTNNIKYTIKNKTIIME